MPSVPPYSSTTIARWWPSRRISDSAESTRLVPGSICTSRASSPTRTVRPAIVRGEQVPDVHEADDVVVRAADDRVAASAALLDDELDRLVDRHRGVQEVDLGARHHHLAQLALAGLEDVVDELPLLASEGLVGGDDVAQLLLGDRARAGRLGSPPSSRTTTLVERDSSQITGRVIRASRSSVGAASSAMPSARCSASRLGASSPRTSDR